MNLSRRTLKVHRRSCTQKPVLNLLARAQSLLLRKTVFPSTVKTITCLDHLVFYKDILLMKLKVTTLPYLKFQPVNFISQNTRRQRKYQRLSVSHKEEMQS